MKKVFVIITLLIISVFSCGSFFVYKAFLSSYKKDFKAYINSNKEVIKTSEITIKTSELYKNTANITWLDENKEIMHNGMLYDVLGKIEIGQKIILTLISDETEHQMKKEFASAYNEKNTGNSSGLLKILKQFLALKFIANSFQFQSAELIASNIRFENSTCNLSKVFIPIFVTPPIA